MSYLAPSTSRTALSMSLCWISPDLSSPGNSLPYSESFMLMSMPALIASLAASRPSLATPCLISSTIAPWSLTVRPLKPQSLRSRSFISQVLAVAGTPLIELSATITPPEPALIAAW
ncbi:hypothetical protein PFLmoz3_02956 [Pseudomonas fluorescens]|uniref:Uncharacterized protein n=1 Tax=Pseudomonas fluorescens TaxID=294 RepID=A0A109LG61_PSEFL|nr:hypothetical protein PFLmoz3_02956 [Pseudomonas fluorescens]